MAERGWETQSPGAAPALHPLASPRGSPQNPAPQKTA